MELHELFRAERRWSREAVARSDVLEGLRRDAPVILPEELIAFYAASNGGEGELAIEPGWFSLWRAEDIVSRNVEYEVLQEYPDYLGFGSNGAGELLVFEVTRGRCGRVAMLAFIGGAPIVVATSFSQFITFIGRPYDPEKVSHGSAARPNF